MHRVLDVANKGPISLTGVELLARAAMDGDHANAAGLRDTGEIGRIQAVMVPAHAHLERDRHRHGLHHGFQNARGGNFIAHERAARALAKRHFLDRAAEIDIHHGGAAIHHQLGCFRHGCRVAAGQLHGSGAAKPIQFRHFQRLAVFPHHGLRGDHLRHHHGCAERPREAPEGLVSHTGHRGQDDRRRNGQAAEVNRLQKRQIHAACTNFALNLCKIPENPSINNLILPASQDSCRVTGQDCLPRSFHGGLVLRRIHAA